MLSHGVVQCTCGSINQLPLQIETLLLDGQGIQNFGSGFQGGRLAYDDFFHILQAQSRQISVPVESRIILLQFFEGHLIVVGMRVTQFRSRTESFGKTGFHIHHYLHTFLGGRFIKACQLVHLLYMVTESITDFSGRFIVFQVIFTLAHAQACLIGLYSIHATIHLIGTYIYHIVGNDTLFLHFAQQCIKFFFVFQGRQLLEFRLDRSHTVLVQFHAIHHNFVQVTYFLCHTTAFVLSGS